MSWMFPQPEFAPRAAVCGSVIRRTIVNNVAQAVDNHLTTSLARLCDP